nr:sigma-70 family RNA polymerase sigma factor [Corynebacterium phocae]
MDKLLQLVGQEDRRAFSRLYDLLSPLAYGVILNVVGNPTLAEEVLQEVFIEVWDKARTFNSGLGRARTWVGRLAHSRAVDRVRSHAAAVERDDKDWVLGTRDRVLDVESLALDRIESRELREAVDSIGEPHRTAILLTFFGGLSHSELAESTSVPLGTAKTRVRDGVKKLSAIWTDSKGGTGRE